MATVIETGAKEGDERVKERLADLVDCLIATRNRYQGYLEELAMADRGQPVPWGWGPAEPG
ncbi:hypothetical protein FCL40_04935 [Ferrimonas sediminicola]|uniref:Uncharacterized protein n=1 Tax=Ferrimonas sediminicola TaxID=2569538 RepID=A0A4U1BGN4_9GAMM|nr:hypothetical protein [Ferrimonas sediminicola]TKB50498.1 hypothetical protein FCL40_04935 [Ferrimonas sediminicola]